MRNTIVSPILVAVALFVAGWAHQPALAQFGGTGDPVSGDDDSLNVSPGYSPWLSGYYAPYALQAAAAYISPAEFDRRRGRTELSSWDGSVVASDVVLAVAAYPIDQKESRKNVRPHAAKYLRLWQYQFGREGYLDCLDKNPDSECRRALKAEGRRRVSGGPSFHVWARYSQNQRVACNEVSIAFRGTDPNKSYLSADWAANLRFFNPLGWRYDDHYRQLRRNIDAIVTTIVNLPCYRRATPSPQIVSVGHSLGAGLAEFAALANNPNGPPIVKVFSFNASPETGSVLIDKETLSHNAERLEIDRVFQTGEINKRIRDWAREDFPPSSSRCRPQVRNVEYGVFQQASSTDLHTMKGLARELVRASLRVKDHETPRKQADPADPADRCSTDYRLPAADEYELPARDLAPAPEIAAPPVAPPTRSTRAMQGRALASYLRTDSFESAFQQPAEMAGSVVGLAGERGARRTKMVAARGAKRATELGSSAVRFDHAALLRD
jgi:hypothetical protein